MWRAFLEPRWYRYWALAAVFMVICIFLGRWQWARYAERAAEVSAVEHHYDASPLALSPTSEVAQSLTQDQEWTRVRTTCVLPTRPPLLVRNRPGPGRAFGYEVAQVCNWPGAPASRPSGVLLDFGWVPSGPNAARPPEYQRPPTGEVTVEGWLRPAEAELGHELASGQLGSLHPATAAQQEGQRLGEVYVAVGSVMGGTDVPAADTAVAISPLPRPDASTGSHLAYALQWWTFSLMGWVLVGAMARKEYLKANPEAAANRPQRTWIWDEEDE